MAKTEVVLVVLNDLEGAINNLNPDKVNLRAVMIDNGDEQTFSFGSAQVPLNSILSSRRLIRNYPKALFLISGYENNIGDVGRMRTFLAENGVPEENIVNFEISSQISKKWLANLKYIKENGADFFATGNEYMQGGLNLNFIPRVSKENLGGVILADEHQDLQQSYQIAKHVFKHVKPGTIKFVLIGLAPDSFHYDASKDFANYAKNFQYTFALNLPEKNPHDGLLKKILGKEFLVASTENVDLNFDGDGIKNDFANEIEHGISAEGMIDWEESLGAFELTEEDFPPFKDYMASCLKNIQILKDYVKLCTKNGAKPVGVVFPFAEIVRKNYNKDVLNFFRNKIRELEKSSEFICIDWLDHLGYDCFWDVTHLNLNGMCLMNSLIAMKLNVANIIPTENFLEVNYEYLRKLSWTASKKDYNDFMERVFKKSVKAIRSKDKIKILFMTRRADEWCGDDVYNVFANDERFDVKIFMIFEFAIEERRDNKIFKENYWHGVEQFRQRGLNVIAIEDEETAKLYRDEWDSQDVVFYLLPYNEPFSEIFYYGNLLAKTLTVHTPYGIGIAMRREKYYYNLGFFRIVWKMFFTSKVELKIYDKEVSKGMPRGIFSGYPRTDFFFGDMAEVQFDWKMARPDAKKVIWAPHWSINGGINQATFQWNYKFMYEFAKNHPEISWVVKPHPGLFYSTVLEQLFPSEEAFKEYLQAWDDLPNARVFTGGYYQEIFATSDGMIHDCGSFIAEYQYVDKPMIFLTREGEEFNELGNEILAASYLVDGQDLDAIGETIQQVIIGGGDFKANERKAVFDKYLNYTKLNGMLASEFIHKSIAEALMPE